MTFYKKILVVFFSIIAFVSKAQLNEDGTEDIMAVAMRSNGKIYVVVAVLTIVLTGILIYVINTDKKITRLEEEIANK